MKIITLLKQSFFYFNVKQYLIIYQIDFKDNFNSSVRLFIDSSNNPNYYKF